MTITQYASEIILCDEANGNERVCTIKLMDGSSATVTMSRVTNAREWKQISDNVFCALRDMNLEGDDRD